MRRSTGLGLRRCLRDIELPSFRSNSRVIPATLPFGQRASFKYNIHMIPSQLGKFLVIAGVLLVAVGLLLMAGVKFFFSLGRLPGDIAYKGKNVQFYFPIVTCLVLSAVLTLVFWLISLFHEAVKRVISYQSSVLSSISQHA